MQHAGTEECVTFRPGSAAGRTNLSFETEDVWTNLF